MSEGMSEGMSERYVGKVIGKLCRKGMLEEIPEGMSDGMSEVWGRWGRAGNLAVTWRMLAARTKPQGLTQDPRPPQGRNQAPMLCITQIGP